MDIKTEFVILMPSCDNYSDLWKPVFDNLFLMCSDFSLKIYLITNFKDFEYPGVTVIKVGDDISWSNNILLALKQINEKYIMLMLEDLFINKKFTMHLLENYFSVFAKENMDYLKLVTGDPGPEKRNVFPNIGKCGTNDYYRTSTVMSIWKKTVLQNLLKSDENAWEFEYYGSIRSSKYEKWYNCQTDVFTFDNLVIKGKIEPHALDNINKRGVIIETNRPIMDTKQQRRNSLINFRSKIFSILPRKAKIVIKHNMFSKNP